MKVLVRLGAVAALAAIALPAAGAVSAPTPAFPPPAVMRIPSFAAMARLPEPDAQLVSGEFASPLRTRADRFALAEAIERQRSAENERWSRGERGVVVPLRRARF